MATASETRVPCSEDTRSRLWDAKEGGETFDELFNRLLEETEPNTNR